MLANLLAVHNQQIERVNVNIKVEPGPPTLMFRDPNQARAYEK